MPLALAGRLTDPVGAHGAGSGGAGGGERTVSETAGRGTFWGIVAGVAAGVAIGALAIATAPVTLTAIAVGGAIAGVVSLGTMGAATGLQWDVADKKEQDNAAQAATLAGNAAARAAGKKMGAGCSKITSASPNVFIESQAAGRVSDPNDHRPSSPTIAEGSEWVLINGRPATRDGDKSTCGGIVMSNARRTYIGGPPKSAATAAAAAAAPGMLAGMWSSLTGLFDGNKWRNALNGDVNATIELLGGVSLATGVVGAVAAAPVAGARLATAATGSRAVGMGTAAKWGAPSVGAGFAAGIPGGHYAGEYAGAKAQEWGWSEKNTILAQTGGGLAGGVLAGGAAGGGAHVLTNRRANGGPARAASLDRSADRLDALAERNPSVAERATRQADRQRAEAELYREQGSGPRQTVSQRDIDARVAQKGAAQRDAEYLTSDNADYSKAARTAADRAEQAAANAPPEQRAKLLESAKELRARADVTDKMRPPGTLGPGGQQMARINRGRARAAARRHADGGGAAEGGSGQAKAGGQGCATCNKNAGGQKNAPKAGSYEDLSLRLKRGEALTSVEHKRYAQGRLKELLAKKTVTPGELRELKAMLEVHHLGRGQFSSVAEFGDKIYKVPLAEQPLAGGGKGPISREEGVAQYKAQKAVVDFLREDPEIAKMVPPVSIPEAGLLEVPKVGGMSFKELAKAKGLNSPEVATAKAEIRRSTDAVAARLARPDAPATPGFEVRADPGISLGNHKFGPDGKLIEHGSFDPVALLRNKNEPLVGEGPPGGRDGMVPQQSQQQQSAHQPSQAQRDLQAQQMAEQRARQDALRGSDEPQQPQQQQQQQAGPRPLEDAALPETGAQIPRRFDRFEANAGELAPENLVVTHGVNEDQLAGGTRAGHGGVRNLSNEDLVRYGGPNGDDPIVAMRAYGPGDSTYGPGPRLIVRAGHHRIHEINRRVQAGLMPADTPVQMQVATGERPIIASNQLCTTCSDAGVAPSAAGISRQATALEGSPYATPKAAGAPVAGNAAKTLSPAEPLPFDAFKIDFPAPPPPPKPAAPPKPEAGRKKLSVRQMEEFKGVKASHPERIAKADALYPGDQTQGSCALMTCGQLIEGSTGKRYTEVELMQMGTQKGIWTNDEGMGVLGAKQLLWDHGVGMVDIEPIATQVRPADWDPMLPNSPKIDYRPSVVDAIDQGYGVYSGHSTGRLYGTGGGGGHAIMAVDVLRDSAGTVTHVVVNDTGGSLGSTVSIPADLYFGSMTSAMRTETPMWGP